MNKRSIPKKRWIITLTLLLLVAGVTRVILSMAAEPTKIAQSEKQTEKQDYSGPFFGQKPEEVSKAYEEMVKDAEEQKKAVVEDKDQNKNNKSNFKTQNKNKPQMENSSKTIAPAEESPTSVTTTPSNTEDQTKPAETHKPESDDFIRGY